MSAGRDLLRHLLDAVFLLGVVFKGLDGLVELIVGIPLLFLPPTTITAVVGHLATHLHGHDALLLGVYLVVHAVVKLAIVTALIVGALRVYPWAIAALGALTIAQLVDLCLHPSIGVAALTALDLVIIALTWREWRERHSLRQTWSATLAWLRRRPEPAPPPGVTRTAAVSGPPARGSRRARRRRR